MGVYGGTGIRQECTTGVNGGRKGYERLLDGEVYNVIGLYAVNGVGITYHLFAKSGIMEQLECYFERLTYSYFILELMKLCDKSNALFYEKQMK